MLKRVLERQLAAFGQDQKDAAALVGVGEAPRPEQLDSRELYHEALTGANEELAKLNTKLLDRGATLQAKARYFDVLAELSRQLRPAARPSTRIRRTIRRGWERNHLHGIA